MNTTRFARAASALIFAITANLYGVAGLAQAAPAQHGDGPAHTESADATFVVRVIIEEVLATNNFDGDPFFDKADFFAVVRIGSTVQSSPAASNDQNPKPNWEISSPVNVPGFSSDVISVTIDIRDSDDCGTAPTCGNQADITTDANRELNLNIDLSVCATPGAGNGISGAVSGNCGQTIVTAGTTGPGTENTAVLSFRIVVDPPPSAPGVNVRAWHDTVWPQGGETLTFSAEALDDTEALAPKLVSRIEIWIDNTLVRSCAANSTCATTRIAPPAGGSISYRADVIDGDVTVSTGWRSVQVGQPPEGRAVPILLTGPRASRVDIALVPATGSYAEPSAAAFRADALLGMRAYFGRRWLLKNQDKFNFWIAQDFGTANGFGTGASCVVEPGNWNSTYAFVESGAIIHTNPLRDCARPSARIFTAEPFDPNVMLHEAGHAAFGLADEYCCDSAYFVPNPLPNIYDSLSACQSEILLLQPFDDRIGVPARTGASCRQISDGTNTIPYFKSDPDDDLMLGNGRIQGADLRRMEWIFNTLCASAACGIAGRIAAANADAEAGAAAPPAFDFLANRKLVTVRALASNPISLTLGGYTGTATVAPGIIASSFQSPDALRVQGLNVSGTLLSETRLWHPLTEKGWNIGGSTEFPVKLHGADRRVMSSTVTLTVPFSPQLRRMRVLGPNGSTLAEIDVLPALQAYCAVNAGDVDCRTVPAAGPQIKVHMPFVQR
jgi:hypothetical protein